jgi:serine/threonine protein kinase
MLAQPAEYDEKGNLDISSIDLRVVDFGIFGSIAGIRMENVNCGSLKYMAPELLQGKMESSPKIDIWSIGLMLHAMVLGFLPFNSRDKQQLEKQICNYELNYKNIKRIKNSSIKDP